MKIRKNINLEEDILKKALKKAKLMGFNFSAYVTYLINRDLNGETAITKEEPKKDNKVSSAIAGILGD